MMAIHHCSCPERIAERANHISYQATYTGPPEHTPGVEILYRDGRPRYIIHTVMFSAVDDASAREACRRTLERHPEWKLELLYRTTVVWTAAAVRHAELYTERPGEACIPEDCGEPPQRIAAGRDAR